MERHAGGNDMPSTIAGVVARGKEDVMTSILGFIKRHPLLTYYALVFAITWGGMLIVLGPAVVLGTKKLSQGQFLPVVYLATLAGPGVAGILSAGLIDGRAGLGGLLSRLLTWRVGVRWYAVALLTAPLWGSLPSSFRAISDRW